MKRVVGVLAIAILLFSLATPVSTTSAAYRGLRRVAFSNNPLYVSQGKSFVMGYTLDANCYIYANIFKGKTNVKTLKYRSFERPGRHSVRWNGKNKSGEYVGRGNYVLRVVVKSKRTRRSYYNYKTITVHRPLNKILGVVVGGSPSVEVPQLESLTGYKFGSYQRFQSSTQDFDRSLADWLYARNMTMELCWMPRDPSNPSIEQPEYRLSTIINGDHDSTITRWATQMKEFGKLIYMRPMPEMNDEKTWGGNANGNSPSEYIPAWRHIYNIFQQVGATNVKFVWCPNRDSSYSRAEETFKTYYPGDNYVDYTGFDGYNFGTIYDDSQWRSLDEVLKYSYTVFARSTNKQIVISEIASTEMGGNKATWTKDFLLKMKYYYPRIARVYWFNIDKQTDFRIQSSQSNLEIFKAYSK